LKLTSVLIVALTLTGAGVAAGWHVANQHDYAAYHKFPLLDPSVNDPNVHQEIINFDPLRQTLKAYLASLNVQHSLYFEYLPNGTNIRDGDDNISQAASLMKTPIVMDLYKLAELGMINLDQPVTVTQDEISTDPEFGNTTGLKPGDKITLRHAAEITLHNSDNTAFAVIGNSIRPLLKNNTDSVQNLDITFSTNGNKPGNEQVLISSRSYSSILKCLYYSCFNSPQDSTTMINFLSDSSDSHRLMAGVEGSGVRVAHKVGSSPVSQSDCGIIYYPKRPYLVCLMLFNIPSGTNVDQYFEQVSQTIYDYVASIGDN